MFSHLKRRFPISQARRRRPGRQLQIEGLEGRTMLSLTAINFGATVTSAPVAIGGELFFTAQDATHGVQLWESNGTSAGTVRLTDGNDVNGGIDPTDLTAVGGTLYFSANDGYLGFGGLGDGDQLWKSDGTAAGTVMVTDGNDGVPQAGMYPYDLTAVGGMLYFVALDMGDGAQVFKSDGTAAGTAMVKDIAGANNYPGCYPSDLTAVGGQLYFSASSANQGTQLWATNGTAAGTVQLTSGNASGGGTTPQFLASSGGVAYFSGFDAADKMQLWTSNGTAGGTRRLTTANAAGAGMSPQFVTGSGGTAYYSASDGVHGAQLWSSNGTTTTMLTGGNVAGGGEAPGDLTMVGSTLYFSANDGVHGTQLWKSDGTAGGTAMVADINGTTTADVTNITAVGGTAYFAAYTAQGGFQVWQTDGTASGTVVDTSLATGTMAPRDLTAMGNSLYFLAPGATLWAWAPATAQTAPTITWATPAGITYGTALSSTQLGATASVAGTFAYSPAAGTVPKAGNDTLSVTFTPTDTADYKTVTASVTLAVAQATPTITWATPAGITYGTALSSAQLGASSSVAGTFAYSPAAGTVPKAGNDTLSATFTPADTVDYTTATKSVTLAVAQATPAITWATPAGITYGTALSSTQLGATASVAGTFAYSPAAGTVPKAGSDTLSVTFTPTDTADYKTVTASVTLAVAQATPTITWATPAGITYGTALSSAQLGASSSVAGTFAYSPAAGTVPKAGNDTLSVTFTPTDTADYTTATKSVTLAVAQATPAITWATPAAITSGTALSSSQLNASSSVAGTFVYSPAAGTVLPLGSNTLATTFTPNDTTDYKTATSTTTIAVVTQAVPTITWATPAGITYGTALSSTQLGATASVAGTFAYSPAAGTVPKAGNDTLSVTFTPTDTADYTTATKSVTLAVAQATPAITWPTPAGITYGTALSSTQLNATASVAGTFAYSPAAGTMPKAGTDTLSVTFTPADTTDYTTATASRTIAVTQAVPGIVWNTPAGINYGTALSSTQLNATGSVPGTLVYSPAAGTVPKAGKDTLSVTLNPTDSTDYMSVTTTVAILVAQATPTISWTNPASITQGTALSSTQLNATASVAGTFSYSPAAGTVLTVGNGQTLSVTFTPSDTTDYTGASATATINVLPALPPGSTSTTAPALTPTAINFGATVTSAPVAIERRAVLHGPGRDARRAALGVQRHLRRHRPPHRRQRRQRRHRSHRPDRRRQYALLLRQRRLPRLRRPRRRRPALEERRHGRRDRHGHRRQRRRAPGRHVPLRPDRRRRHALLRRPGHAATAPRSSRATVRRPARRW